MNKNLLLSRANIRKAKGQTAVIIVLVLLASIMMNLWLMLGTDYKENFDRCHDRLNEGHITISAYRRDTEFQSITENLLKSREDVAEYCMTDALGWVGTFEYNGGEASSHLIFLDEDTALSRKVGKVEITEDSDLTSGIYIPVLYSASYAIGDEIELSLGSEKLKYTVVGYINSAMAGSHNCALCVMMLTKDKYAELEKRGTIPELTFISVRINDKSKSDDIETELADLILEEFPATIMMTNSYELVSSSRFVSQSICAAILSAMAFLITLIAVVVISSNVMNYIHENMQNLGALKAIGYKSGQLISALIMQFSGIALITAAIGIALSYGVFPALNEMMIAQTGIPYEVRFLPLPCAATLVFMVGVISAAVFLSAKRIRVIEPITALRQGIQTHSFRKNHVPLDKSISPLNLTLALKNMLSGMKQNITIAVTMLTMSLIIVFSGVMTQNFIADKQAFLGIVVGETADSCINVNPTAEEQLKTALKNDSRTEKFYFYTSNNVTHVGGVTLMMTASDDFENLSNHSVIIEGRFPKFDNEIAVAVKYAREKNLKIGEEISIAAGAKEEKYIISGFTQISNNLGKDCLMTREGFERISKFTNASYYINVKDGTDIDEFNKDITASFSGEVNATMNMAEIIEGSSKVYISLITVIVIAILILSGIIVAFVLYLLVRTMLGNKKHDYGILKALGYTTGQLVLQTALSFMPPIIISTVLGIIVSTFVINPLLALFLSGIGIVKCMFIVPLYFNIIAGLGLILFAFVATCLLSLRVRKIAPRVLLTGE